MRLLNYSVVAKAVLGLLVFSVASAGMAEAKKPLTAQEICQRLQVTEVVLVFDESGEHIVDSDVRVRGGGSGPEGPGDSSEKDSNVKCSNGSSSGQSSSSFDGPIFFHHEWNVLADGRIKVSYEQGQRFEGRGRDAKLVGSTGRQELILKDFSPVSWTSPLHKKQRVVVRLVPTLRAGESTKELGQFPITIENGLIYDGAGKLWAINLTAEGEFIAMTTLHGGLMVGFKPFPGGKKIGRASGREIRFKARDGATIVIKSETPILPGQIAADVYVMVDPKYKSKSVTSQSISSGKDPNEVLERMANNSRR
jgi:hypothetical protein